MHPKQIRIGFVSTQLGWGGGENLLAQLITGVRRLGAEAVLASPRGSAMAEWASRQHDLTQLELPGRGRGPAAAWRLRKWFSDKSCDIALLNDPHAITWGGLGLQGAGIPRVGIRHTSFPVRSAWKHTRLIDRVVCVSEAARDECLAVGVPAERLEVIYAGLDPPEQETQQVEAARRLFAENSAGPEERHLLAIGSLLPVKGFDTLIEGFAEGIARGESWRLWIAGEGSEREGLETLALERGVADRVHLLGFRDDIGALLSAADLFVSPSHQEGLSLVIIEAMLSNTPVAATPVGGARETLRMTDGRASDVAWSFDPGDPKGMLEAITTALSDPEDMARRVKKAHAWSSERFSLERMAGDYLAVFATALGHELSRSNAA